MSVPLFQRRDKNGDKSHFLSNLSNKTIIGLIFDKNDDKSHFLSKDIIGPTYLTKMATKATFWAFLKFAIQECSDGQIWQQNAIFWGNCCFGPLETFPKANFGPLLYDYNYTGLFQNNCHLLIILDFLKINKFFAKTFTVSKYVVVHLVYEREYKLVFIHVGTKKTAWVIIHFPSFLTPLTKWQSRDDFKGFLRFFKMT